MTRSILNAPQLLLPGEDWGRAAELSHGEAESVLHTLYDHILEETVPPRILELLRRYERIRDDSESALPQR